MFNKTDMTNSKNVQNGAAFIASQKLTDHVVQLQANPENVNNSFPNNVVAYFKKLSLGTKAVILAIAIGTIPVVTIGAIAYGLGSKSMSKQIIQSQQTVATDVSEQVNRFMLGRYSDIQTLANLPFLTNLQLRASTTKKEKQAVLDRLVEAYKVYDNIAVFDIEGDLIVQSTGETLDHLKDSSYFQDALKKEMTIISQPETASNTGLLNIYIAAPVKDVVTGNTIGVMRTSMPIKYLDEAIKNYVANKQQYHLLNAAGKVLLSSQKTLVNKEAKAEYPGLAKLLAAKKIDSVTTVQKTQQKQELLSYVPSQKLEGLPNLNWQVLLSTDTVVAFEPQRQLSWMIVIGTVLTAGIVSAIAVWLAKRIVQPILNANAALTAVIQGEFNSTPLLVETADELGVLNANINQIAERSQFLVKEQKMDAEATKLIADITLKIRCIITADYIYQTAAQEIRQALKTDRVIIYKFNQHTWDGNIVAESIADAWPQMIGLYIDDPYFREQHLETYKNRQVQVINNIYQDHSLKNADAYTQLLERFAVKSNLIAPIIVQEKLLGLLIVHHCETPRIWQKSEINLLQQIANQIGYALEQAQLLEKLEKARNHHTEHDIEEEWEQKQALHLQLSDLLNAVEGAARGDLTVRADVTAGEIGTVADFFNSIVESLRDIVTQVQQAANQVNSAVDFNEGAIRQLADEALTQAAEINRTLNAVDDMKQSIQAVAESAQTAATIANHAAHTATKSGQAMDLTVHNILSLRETVDETTKKVKRLGESSQQISRVVSLINQIAIQTNLLAINAGIEAARAGEEGQGFAVVAEEVGELAVRSAAATQEIEQIVENIQRETSEVVQAMEVGTTQVVEGTLIVEEAKQNLSQILDVSRQIDTLVQSISAATTSQVETSQTVSQLMKDIAAVSQRTSDSSRLVSKSLQQTVEISHQLQETVETFKVS
ncbi:MAG: GAF domain-containing protein [Desmonostoc vinosum HA7617-LM4]|jgi:twitching motility protein PilJ|nr:GAF domain-containing protein [Desmonostoc vinosum HA7617-LM4]